METALFAIKLVDALIALADAGKDIYDIGNKGNDILRAAKDESRAVSDSEWEWIDQVVDDLRSARPDV